MKSITPVVSVILLIMLSIGVSVAAYFFINQTTGRIQSSDQLDSFPGLDNSQLTLVSIRGSSAIVRNAGTSPVTELIMFVNGELLNYDLEEPLLPGQVKEINYNPRLIDEELEIKIIYNNGKQIIQSSPAQRNTIDSGFTDEVLPLNIEPACNIVFSDSEPPAIEVLNFDAICPPCVTSPKKYLKIRLNVTDDIPLREVIYENNEALNFSLTPYGISGVYELILYADDVIDGTHGAYAKDWLNNTKYINLGTTPNIYNVGCAVAACDVEAKPTVEDYNSTSEICYGDKITVNSTYSVSSSIPKTVTIKLYYPNIDNYESIEYFYLETLNELTNLSWGGYYYPQISGQYELIMTSSPESGGLTNTELGTLTVSE